MAKFLLSYDQNVPRHVTLVGNLKVLQSSVKTNTLFTTTMFSMIISICKNVFTELC